MDTMSGLNCENQYVVRGESLYCCNTRIDSRERENQTGIGQVYESVPKKVCSLDIKQGTLPQHKNKNLDLALNTKQRDRNAI